METWQHFSIIWLLIVGLGITRSLLFIGLYIEYRIKSTNSEEYDLVDSPLLIIALCGTIIFSVMFWWILTPAAYMYEHPEVQMSVTTYLMLFFHAVMFFIILDLYTPELDISNEHWDLDSHYWRVIKPSMILMFMLFLISMLLLVSLSTDVRPTIMDSLRAMKKLLMGWPILLAMSGVIFFTKSERIHLLCQSVICFVLPLVLSVAAPKYGRIDRDLDMDFVPNIKDMCPETIPEQTFDVDLRGCSPEQNAARKEQKKQVSE